MGSNPTPSANRRSAFARYRAFVLLTSFEEIEDQRGLLMFQRIGGGTIKVLLAHPGGPYFAHKDDGYWTIPKGEAVEGEDLLSRALIEFKEELGFPAAGEWIELGWVQQKGGKIVHAWAFEGELPKAFAHRCNLFEMEWPPRSGKFEQFPEIDRVAFFPLEQARLKIKAAQSPFLDRLDLATGNAHHPNAG